LSPILSQVLEKMYAKKENDSSGFVREIYSPVNLRGFTRDYYSYEGIKCYLEEHPGFELNSSQVRFMKRWEDGICISLRPQAHLGWTDSHLLYIYEMIEKSKVTKDSELLRRHLERDCLPPAMPDNKLLDYVQRFLRAREGKFPDYSAWYKQKLEDLNFSVEPLSSTDTGSGERENELCEKKSSDLPCLQVEGLAQGQSVSKILVDPPEDRLKGDRELSSAEKAKKDVPQVDRVLEVSKVVEPLFVRTTPVDVPCWVLTEAQWEGILCP